jgi:hypothetical protein
LSDGDSLLQILEHLKAADFSVKFCPKSIPQEVKQGKIACRRTNKVQEDAAKPSAPHPENSWSRATIASFFRSVLAQLPFNDISARNNLNGQHIMPSRFYNFTIHYRNECLLSPTKVFIMTAWQSQDKNALPMSRPIEGLLPVPLV